MNIIKEDDGGSSGGLAANHTGMGVNNYDPMLALKGPKKKPHGLGMASAISGHANKDKLGKPLSTIVRRDTLKAVINNIKKKPKPL